MKKVITYGTYDLIHHGHIKLLERAKNLGDYLIVGVTSDDFDKRRGKINVQQSLMERIENVRSTGLADEIIVEEYEGQKIDDIKRLNIDIFAIGSDWQEKFDYLKTYCEVVYLKRTEGISSSEIRSKNQKIKIGLVGEKKIIEKFYNESKFVNGLEVVGIFTKESLDSDLKKLKVKNYSELIEKADAIYIVSHPKKHFNQIKIALNNFKHVLCESPMTLNKLQYEKVKEIAFENKCILMESIKTAYSTAYNRLLLLAKSGKIGKIVSIDATCTSLRNILNRKETSNSISAWGPTALLPIFQILGTDYLEKRIITLLEDENLDFDLFTKVDFIYSNAVASVKVGQGMKSEGELIISGTKGYIYVPSPWWKLDYFEVRYEDFTENERYFYQLEGEGIRLELISFIRAINMQKNNSNISDKVTKEIVSLIEEYYKRNYKKLVLN